jgi:hypothetical protein
MDAPPRHFVTSVNKKHEEIINKYRKEFRKAQLDRLEFQRAK